MSDNNDLPPDCDAIEGQQLPTLCDGDTSNNYWFEDGVCMLDQMTPSQVTYAIQRNHQARNDLKRVTTCQDLHDLLDHVPLLNPNEEEDVAQKAFNEGTALPFYTVFRGNLNNM